MTQHLLVGAGVPKTSKTSRRAEARESTALSAEARRLLLLLLLLHQTAE